MSHEEVLTVLNLIVLSRIRPPQLLTESIQECSVSTCTCFTYRFTSLPSAHDLGGENPYIDTKDVLKLLNCGRLGRQAAGHPWSALRVVEKLPKDCPTASVLPKPKQQLCIQSGTRAHYLNYLQKREGEAGKRNAGNRIG